VLRVIFAFHRRRARQLGARPARANSTGAVSVLQRFNSALALALHGHILVADGVFLRPVRPRARSPLAWADLMQRTFAADVLRCGRGGGELR